MTSTRRRTLGAFEKLRLRIDYLTTSDGVRALAQRHGTNPATVSRCTSGSGFDRKRPAARQTGQLAVCWNKDAGPKAKASHQDIVLLVVGLTLHTPAGRVICDSLQDCSVDTSPTSAESMSTEPLPVAGMGRNRPETGLLSPMTP